MMKIYHCSENLSLQQNIHHWDEIHQLMNISNYDHIDIFDEKFIIVMKIHFYDKKSLL